MMPATVWRTLRVVPWVTVPASTLLIPGCSDEAGPVGPDEVVVSVTGTVGVEGARLSGIPVTLGAYSRSLAGPEWSRTFDESRTDSNGGYALRGIMDRSPECTGAYVSASFDLPPHTLSYDLEPMYGGRLCESAEVDLELHFPVRRTNLIAQGRILWSDGSAVGRVNVALLVPVDVVLDLTRTDSNGGYRVEAAVLDALCDPDTPHYTGGYANPQLTVSDDGGVTLVESEPLHCGVNEVDLMATSPAGAP